MFNRREHPLSALASQLLLTLWRELTLASRAWIKQAYDRPWRHS